MSPGQIRGLLGAALLAALLAAWFAPPAKDEGVAPSERVQNATTHAGDTTQSATPQALNVAARAVPGAPDEVLSIHARDQEPDDDAQDDRLFSPAQWTRSNRQLPAVNAAPAQIEPASPQAPPLPFRVLGRYEDAGLVAIFLQYNDQNLVVRVGDTLAEKYKVESLVGMSLNLRYLPTNQLQTLEVGGTQLTKE